MFAKHIFFYLKKNNVTKIFLACIENGDFSEVEALIHKTKKYLNHVSLCFHVSKFWCGLQIVMTNILQTDIS